MWPEGDQQIGTNMTKRDRLMILDHEAPQHRIVKTTPRGIVREKETIKRNLNHTQIRTEIDHDLKVMTETKTDHNLWIAKDPKVEKIIIETNTQNQTGIITRIIIKILNQIRIAMIKAKFRMKRNSNTAKTKSLYIFINAKRVLQCIQQDQTATKRTP
jgi:hypothetical protein